ncbi:MAG TPA: hypothetical protein VFH51_08995 [Myxococcota bacterium]|nr:hypothetical protein [Myxococcota bacterium]
MLEVLHQGDTLRVYRYASLQVQLFRGSVPVLRDLDAMARCIRQITAAHPNKLSVLTLLRDYRGLPNISKPYRDRLADLSKLIQADLLASAIVLDGDGLQVSMVRGIAAFALNISRVKAQNKIFKSEAEALPWLAACPGQTWEVQDNHVSLLAAVRQILRSER